jgi:hypothetical protein
LTVRGLSLAGSALIASTLAACVDPEPPRDEDAEEIAKLAIDSDAALELTPGEGVLVGVEYISGGTWRVSSVCDTAYSDEPCLFDVIVDSQDDAGIIDVARIALDDEDRVVRLDAFALDLDWVTGGGADVVEFTTLPGATLRVSVALYDPSATWWGAWAVDPRLLSWVGDGGAHWGAPTDPVDLTPASP